LVCEGFENDLADWTFGVSSNEYGSVAPDARAYRGLRSAHLRSDSSGVPGRYLEAELQTNVDFPFDPLFFRAFVYLPSQRLPQSLDLLVVQQSEDPYGGVALGVTSTRAVQLHDFGLDPPHDLTSSVVLPMDRWVCLEWQVPRSQPDAGTAGSYQVWLDGDELTDLSVGGREVTPPLNTLWLGWAFNAPANTAPLDIWFDEVAVDAQPIGCAR